MSENEIAKRVLDSACIVHTKLGPGLLESVYEVVLAHELRNSGLRVERQRPMAIVYEGIRFDEAFRSDLVVTSETASTERFSKIPTKNFLCDLCGLGARKLKS